MLITGKNNSKSNNHLNASLQDSEIDIDKVDNNIWILFLNFRKENHLGLKNKNSIKNKNENEKNTVKKIKNKRKNC